MSSVGSVTTNQPFDPSSFQSPANTSNSPNNGGMIEITPAALESLLNGANMPPATGGTTMPPATGGAATPPATGGKTTPPATGGTTTPAANGSPTSGMASVKVESSTGGEIDAKEDSKGNLYGSTDQSFGKVNSDGTVSIDESSNKSVTSALNMDPS